MVLSLNSGEPWEPPGSQDSVRWFQSSIIPRGWRTRRSTNRICEHRNYFEVFLDALDPLSGGKAREMGFSEVIKMEGSVSPMVSVWKNILHGHDD